MLRGISQRIQVAHDPSSEEGMIEVVRRSNGMRRLPLKLRDK